MNRSDWSTDRLDRLNTRFEDEPSSTILNWAFETFGDDAVMGTGFGSSGVALMHVLANVQPDATVFFLDTDVLFPETYELKDTLDQRFPLHIQRVHSGVSLDDQKEDHGPELWNRNPDKCCFIRKVQPLRNYLADKHAWITAIRRDQSPTRTDTQFVEWNQSHQVIKINPFADWTEEDVWSYIEEWDLPYNPLHDEGYPSIGCIPCTEPADGTDDLRAGRWRDSDKTECGIHLDPESHDVHRTPEPADSTG